jgi:hypothetical protein
VKAMLQYKERRARVAQNSVSGASLMRADATQMLGILASSAFDYNTVETVLLFCAAVVTLGGIMFESGQLDTATYVKSRDSVTVILMILIIVSIIYYLIVLFTELHMMVTEDARRKRLEQQKAVRSGKEGSGGGAAAPKVDIELGDVQMQNNQFVSMASQEKSSEVSGLEMDAILALEDMDAYTWVQVKAKLRDMQMRFKEMQDSHRDSKLAALADGGVSSGSSSAAVLSSARASPGSPAVNPMMALAAGRRVGRSFGPAQTGGAGSGSGSSSPGMSSAGSRKSLLKKADMKE